MHLPFQPKVDSCHSILSQKLSAATQQSSDYKTSLTSEEPVTAPKQSSHPTMSKEKLKYLRYFRLVTHRKRNDVEIAKLERRKKRYYGHDRSPSPNTIFGSVPCRPERPSSPDLPLPSKHGKLPPDSNAKLMFFTMLGLLKLGETDKKGTPRMAKL